MGWGLMASMAGGETILTLFIGQALSPPVPEPVPVILDKLKVGTVVGHFQLDQRQVHLELTFAGLAENAIELAIKTSRRVKHFQHDAAVLHFLKRGRWLRVVGDEREAEMLYQVLVVSGVRLLVNPRNVIHGTESLDDSILLVASWAGFGNDFQTVPRSISNSRHCLTSMKNNTGTFRRFRTSLPAGPTGII